MDTGRCDRLKDIWFELTVLTICAVLTWWAFV